MSNKGPRHAHREGKSLLNLAEMFPDEDSAVIRFESSFWADGRKYPRRKGTSTYKAKNANGMPFRCRARERYFSV